MDEETDSVARSAVKALIEDAKAEFRGERQEVFAWAIYNAVRHTDSAQLQNLRELLRKHGINPGLEAKRSWFK